MAEAKTVKVEKPVDPMQERETMYVPRLPVGEQQNIYVNINGKGFNIPRGKNVDMPRPVADIIKRALKAEQRYDEGVRDASVHSV